MLSFSKFFKRKLTEHDSDSVLLDDGFYKSNTEGEPEAQQENIAFDADPFQQTKNKSYIDDYSLDDHTTTPLELKGNSNTEDIIDDIIFDLYPEDNTIDVSSKNAQQSDNQTNNQIESKSIQSEETDWLFDFDDTPIVSSDEEEPSSPLSNRHIEEKASFLMGEIATIRHTDIEKTFDRCIHLLEEFPHHTSYMAMRLLLSRGTSLDELEEIANLKIDWRDNPNLWLHRKKGEIFSTPLQRTALSWKVTAALIAKFGIIDAQARLHEDWLSEWCKLTPPPLDEAAQWGIYRNFSSYLSHIATASITTSHTAEPTSSAKSQRRVADVTTRRATSI